MSSVLCLLHVESTVTRCLLCFSYLILLFCPFALNAVSPLKASESLECVWYTYSCFFSSMLFFISLIWTWFFWLWVTLQIQEQVRLTPLWKLWVLPECERKGPNMLQQGAVRSCKRRRQLCLNTFGTFPLLVSQRLFKSCSSSRVSGSCPVVWVQQPLWEGFSHSFCRRYLINSGGL